MNTVWSEVLLHTPSFSSFNLALSVFSDKTGHMNMSIEVLARSTVDFVDIVTQMLSIKLELKYRVEKISKIKRVEDELFLLIFSTRSLTNL